MGENGRLIELQKFLRIIDNQRNIRAVADLLTAAADSIEAGRSEFHQLTLAQIGVHLEDLATESLVLLGEESQPFKQGSDA